MEPSIESPSLEARKMKMEGFEASIEQGVEREGDE